MDNSTKPADGPNLDQSASLLRSQSHPFVKLPDGAQPKLKASDLNFYYGGFKALNDINLDIYESRVTAFIGPSGCGKSTFLRTLNRMHEMVRQTRVEGEILLDGEDVFGLEVSQLRRRVGMVFQKSNPFPKSIFDNVAYGLRINDGARGAGLREAVEKSLRRAALWDEVKDKLNESAYSLSGGQQQRLCIARALAVTPEVLLLDAGPHRNNQNRGSDLSTEGQLHHRHRHPQHAASGSGRRLYRILSPRPSDRVRQDDHHL